MRDDFDLRPSKSEYKLILSNPLTNDQKEIQINSFKEAFQDKLQRFCDDLIYQDGVRELSFNNLHKRYNLNDYDKQVYYQAKAMSAEAVYQPVKIVKDINQGYVVKAFDHIKKYTFICEYSGEVFSSEEVLCMESDSFMVLQEGIKEKNIKELIICPDKITNIARYISGINNLNGQRDQNVYSIRCQIDGYPHILLYALKDIKPNETLYYDYNQGDKSNPYDTKDFVSEKNQIRFNPYSKADNKQTFALVALNQLYPESYNVEFDKNKKEKQPVLPNLLKEQLGDFVNQDSKYIDIDIVESNRETNNYKNVKFLQRNQLLNSYHNFEKRDKTKEKYLNKKSFFYYHK